MMHQNQPNKNISIDNNKGLFTPLEDFIENNIEELKLIVGLGNPGEKYKYNWHNLGQLIIEQIITDKYNQSDLIESKWKNPPGVVYKDSLKKTIWAIPETYMNNSGDFVASVANYFNIKVKNIVIIYDDLDLEVGNNKLKVKNTPKAHNGVNSVISGLGNDDSFYSYRIGVFLKEKRHYFKSGQEYLLSNIPTELRSSIINL